MKADKSAIRIIVPVGFVLAVVGFMIVRPVLAQEASSSVPVDDSSSTSTVSTPDESSATLESATTTQITAEDASITPEALTQPGPDTAQTSKAADGQPPTGLTEVHIIGTKYIDYFTDGINTYTFPGDPQIHAHFAEKDAPIPKHDGLTWVHSTGQYLYDTPSGDLEVGQYALQPNGTYIQKGLPFVSATSSPLSSGSSTAAPDTEVATSTDEASSTSSSIR
jgi:hypothetical protein